jgi:hypothetical protein
VTLRDLKDHPLAALMLDVRMFTNRKPGLRLEFVRLFEMDELVFCLPEKRTSIYARSSFLATGTCPAEPLSYLCLAEPLRTCEW